MIIKLTPLNSSNTITESEKKIVNMSILNMITLVNGLTTKKEMVINPIDNEELSFDVFLAHNVLKEERESFCERVLKQIDTFLMMAEIQYSVVLDDES